ncbi:MAG: hypothetical protein ACO1NZ_12625 [Adhaeribacter sp.]
MSLYRINKHVLQVWLWLFGLSLALLLVVVVALQTSWLQRQAAQQVTHYLSRKLQTSVSIGSFSTDWRHHFVLEDFYLEDQHRDTLVFARRLGVNLDFEALLRRQVSISDVSLSQAVVRVNSSATGPAYNFDFIRKAFPIPAGSPADSSLTFTYQFGELRLEQVRVQIQDSLRGNFILARIGYFGAFQDGPDLHQGGLRFGLVDLHHTTIHIRQTKVAIGPADSLALDLGFRDLRFHDVRLDYAHAAAGQQLQVILGRARVMADTFNLKAARINLAEIQVRDSFLAYYQNKKVRPDSLALRPSRTIARIDQAVELTTRTAFPGWQVRVQRTSLRNLTLVRETYAPRLAPGLVDINHLKLRNLRLDLDSLRCLDQQVSARLRHLSFREESGFRISHLEGLFQAFPGRVQVQEASLQTPTSQVSKVQSLEYGWPADGRDKTRFRLAAALRPSVLSPQDMAWLAPWLPAAAPLPAIYRHPIRFAGNVTLSEDKIRADRLRIRALAGTDFYFTGDIRGLTNDEDSQVDLQVHQLHTTRRDLRRLLPADALPPWLTLPATLHISGRFRGGSTALVLQQVRINTADSTAMAVSGILRRFNRPQRWLDLRVDQFTTSRATLLHLLPPHTISPDLQLPDKMTFSGSFQGTSLDQFQARTYIHTNFGQAVFDLAVEPGEHFSGQGKLIDFDLGKFLKEEKILGRATGRATFQGKGLTFATTRVHFKTSIGHIIYNRAPYRNIDLNGTLDHEEYHVQGTLAKVVAQMIGSKLKKLHPRNMKLPKLRERFGSRQSRPGQH